MATMKTNHVVGLISKIRNNANKLITTELEARGIYGIAPSHGGILIALYQNEKVTMKELANYIDRDKSTVTALVNKLVKLGYVYKFKDITDSRVSVVTLTDKGRELKPAFFEISDTLIEKVYRNFPEKEKEDLVKGLEKVLRNF